MKNMSRSLRSEIHPKVHVVKCAQLKAAKSKTAAHHEPRKNVFMYMNHRTFDRRNIMQPKMRY